MTRSYEMGVRPTTIDQMFYNQFNWPTLNSYVSKSIYWGALSRTVASFNPNYAFFYGFMRGATDYLSATTQYMLFFTCRYDSDYGKHLNDRDVNNPAFKVLWVATNMFVSMLAIYSVTKIGELVYWGGKSLIGRADYRSFGFLDLLKIEGMITLFTVGIDLGVKGVGALLGEDASINDQRPANCERYSSHFQRRYDQQD